MKLILFTALSLLLMCQPSYAWYGSRTQSSLTASLDAVAASDDLRSVGVYNTGWKHGYFSFLKFKQKDRASDPVFADEASYGVVYVSLDNHIYYRHASGGVTTQLDA